MKARVSLDDLQHLQELLTDLNIDTELQQRLSDWVATAIHVRLAQKTRSRTPAHDELMAAYEAAVHQWELACEAATNGYQAEMVEFAEKHPRPTLRAFLQGTRRRSDICPVCRQPLPADAPAEVAA
jgi:hypothetical protein